MKMLSSYGIDIDWIGEDRNHLLYGGYSWFVSYEGGFYCMVDKNDDLYSYSYLKISGYEEYEHGFKYMISGSCIFHWVDRILL